VPIILYHRMPDGLIRYERAANPASELPTTQKLLVVGPGDVPDAPDHTATPVEHNAWLQRCRDAGCTVKVEALTAEQE
jgi:hypothetical protein